MNSVTIFIQHLYEKVSDCVVKFISSLLCTYRVAQKSKLLILSEYVNKTAKIGGM